MKNILLPMIVAAVAAAPATAQQLNGATLTGTFQNVNDSNLDTTAITLSGGLDYGFGPRFSVGGAVEIVSAEDFDDEVINATVRGTYNTSPNGGVGLFYAAESQGSIDVASYGVEGAFASQNGSFEAYYGVTDADVFGDDDLTIAGLGFEIAVGAGFSIGLLYESYTISDAILLPTSLELEDLTIGDTSLIARYTFAEGASAFAQFGQIKASVSDGNDTFVSEEGIDYILIGAEYKFGRGALFDARTLNSLGG